MDVWRSAWRRSLAGITPDTTRYNNTYNKTHTYNTYNIYKQC
jgi:hypothetical protein